MNDDCLFFGLVYADAVACLLSFALGWVLSNEFRSDKKKEARK